jgi:hemolysin activation/secretion protein
MSFDIYKQDTTFLNTKASIDLKYILNPQTIVAAKYQSENSNDLTTTDSQSSIREFKNNFYGVSFEKNIFDTKRNYQNKFFFRLDAIWGNRTLISESLNTDQSKYELTTYYNWSLNQKNSIFIQNHSALLISDELFTNELFRIGGTNSIRGFNEQSIFTSSHTILNLEYRYHLYNSSYLFSITDFAYINNDLLNNDTQLYSFGIGYEYKLKNGVINLSYALGKEADIPIDIDNSRFHIKFFQFF